MRVFLTIMTLVFGQAVTSAQGLTSALDRDTIFIGQPATVVYTFSATDGTVEWKIPNDSIAPGLEILDRKSAINDSEPKVWTETIMFTTSSSGYFPVPPISVMYNGKPIESEAFLITAYTTLKNPKQEELRDIKESTEIRYSWLDWLLDRWLIILITVVVIALIILAIKLLSPKQEAPAEVVAVDTTPVPKAYEIAQHKIKNLEDSKIWKTGELKEFHTSISYLLREYLEGELNISALENTSGEINFALQKFHFPPAVQKQIRVSLSLTDLVKYAKQRPSDSENEQVLKVVKEVVDYIYKHEGKSKED